MIRLISHRRDAPGLVEAMHRDRKAVFVDRLSWSVPVVDGLEIDQFDGDGGAYLVVTGADGGHLGSLRLLPTDRPHLLGTLFPELCAGGVPAGPAIREISRLLTAPGLRAAERLAVRRRLIVALVEHGLASGLERYTCMAGTAWLSQIMAMGWRFELLGPPRLIRGEAVGALALEVDEATLARFRADWGLPEPQLARGLRQAA
jgi:N-acyl-L-homoserine lactone synthetase